MVGDIKFNNFALSCDGQLQLIDFGGSALQPRNRPALLEPIVAASDILCSTFEYRAPELSTEPNVDSRTDVYSCGVMLKLLTECAGIWQPERGASCACTVSSNNVLTCQ